MAIYISYPVSILDPYQPSALGLIWVSRVDMGYMKIAIYVIISIYHIRTDTFSEMQKSNNSGVSLVKITSMYQVYPFLFK